MPHFINPFTDIGFKRIFGQKISKPLIIDFLNSLMEDEEHIEDITTSVTMISTKDLTMRYHFSHINRKNHNVWPYYRVIFYNFAS